MGKIHLDCESTFYAWEFIGQRDLSMHIAYYFVVVAVVIASDAIVGSESGRGASEYIANEQIRTKNESELLFKLTAQLLLQRLIANGRPMLKHVINIEIQHTHSISFWCRRSLESIFSVDMVVCVCAFKVYLLNLLFPSFSRLFYSVLALHPSHASHVFHSHSITFSLAHTLPFWTPIMAHCSSLFLSHCPTILLHPSGRNIKPRTLKLASEKENT